MQSPFDRLPDRMRHYLLAYKDYKKEGFYHEYEVHSLRELSGGALLRFWKEATRHDSWIINIKK